MGSENSPSRAATPPTSEWTSSARPQRGAQHDAAPLQALQALLVVGGGGTLGSAVLAEALVAGRISRVQALVVVPHAPALLRAGMAPPP